MKHFTTLRTVRPGLTGPHVFRVGLTPIQIYIKPHNKDLPASISIIHDIQLSTKIIRQGKRQGKNSLEKHSKYKKQNLIWKSLELSDQEIKINMINYGKGCDGKNG